MTDTNVPTDLPQREPGEAMRTVNVQDLQRGDWVTAGYLNPYNPAEVLHVETFEPGDTGPSMCVVLYRLMHSPEPRSVDLAWGTAGTLATEQDMANLREAQRRTRIVSDARAAISLISEFNLPVPGEYDTAHLGIRLADAEKLQQVADALDLKVDSSGATLSVTWPPRTANSPIYLPFEVTWSAYVPAIADDPLGMAMGRADGDGAFVPGPVPPDAIGLTYRERGAEIEVVHEAERDRAIGTAPIPAREVGGQPHPSWPTEAELKPWESLDPAADRDAESVERMPSIDPDSSMEAHYDAEAGQ